MSVGTIKEGNDVKGDVCKIVDVILNPNVVENIKNNFQIRNFF